MTQVNISKTINLFLVGALTILGLLVIYYAGQYLLIEKIKTPIIEFTELTNSATLTSLIISLILLLGIIVESISSLLRNISKRIIRKKNSQEFISKITFHKKHYLEYVLWKNKFIEKTEDFSSITDLRLSYSVKKRYCKFNHISQGRRNDGANTYETLCNFPTRNKFFVFTY